MSLVMRKPVFCICKNKDADQLRGNRVADQRLCFRYMDSTIPLLHKSDLCWTWSETPKTGFLRTRLKSDRIKHIYGTDDFGVTNSILFRKLRYMRKGLVGFGFNKTFLKKRGFFKYM